MQVVDRIDCRVLSTELRCSRLERLCIVSRPPVAKIAQSVGLAALIVEPVSHLVPDHGSNPAVVHCVVRFNIEERRLKYRSGEDNLVVRRIVVRVHCLRSHAPACTIDWLAKTADCVLVLEDVVSHRIANQVTALDYQCGEITRLVGIADLYCEVRKLVLRLQLCLRAHPGEAVDSNAVRSEDVLHQLVHPGLRLGLEVTLDVELS